MKALRLLPILLLTSFFMSCEEETPTFTLTTSSSPLEGGKVIFSPMGSFNPGQEVTISPEANPGWVFKEWGGDASGTANPLIIEMNSSKNIFAVFTKTFPIVYEIIGNGTVTEKIVENPAGREFPMGSSVEITPVPADGWLFEKWVLKTELEDRISNENPKTITIDGQITVKVVFVPKPIGDPRFYLADNGVTCKCENVIVGSKGLINGVEYEAVDDEFLRIRLKERADMTKLCTSLVTDMNSLFFDYDFNHAIGNWDVSNVIDMNSMFFGSSFNQAIDKWDVSKVKDMSWMFAKVSPWGDEGFGDPPAFNQPLDKWDVSKVTNMSGMFYGSDFDQPIGNWDVGSVTDMSYMFAGFGNQASAKFNQTIGDWNVRNVTNMNGMFMDNYYFNQDLSSWCVIKIPNFPEDFATTGAWLLAKPIWGTCPD